MIEFVLQMNVFIMNYLVYQKDHQDYLMKSCLIPKDYCENNPFNLEAQQKSEVPFFDDWVIAQILRSRKFLYMWSAITVMHALQKQFQRVGGYEYLARYLEKRYFGITGEDGREYIEDFWIFMNYLDVIYPGIQDSYFFYIIHYKIVLKYVFIVFKSLLI